MAQKTAIGGLDGNWLPIVAALVSLGGLPKSLKPWVGTASASLLVYKIGKQQGWW
jgi:hypothetical protein